MEMKLSSSFQLDPRRFHSQKLMLGKLISKNQVLMEVEESETEVKVSMERIIEVVLVVVKASMVTNLLTTMVEARLLMMQEKRQWLLIHPCINHIHQQEI
jgi:hypothetical protein